MMQFRIVRGACLLAAALFVVGVAGCRVHVDKGKNGEDKNVRVDTPFGGVHVNTNQTTAADLGLPAYPGAQPVKDDDHSSADVHLGFGEWQLRVRVAGYDSADDQQKIVDFYRKALASYGDVLTCQNNRPVGKPTMTSQGLTCDDDSKHVNVNVHGGKGNLEMGDLQLKTGSKRHQRIVCFEKPIHGRTKFDLMSLDLPQETGKSKGD